MPIILYKPTQKAQVNAGQANLQSANLDVQGAYKRNNVMEGVLPFVEGGLRLGKAWLDMSRVSDVTEMSLAFQKDLNDYRNDYMSKNKGKNALEAGADFENYANQRLSELQENNSLDQTTRLMLGRATGPAAIGFIGTGQQYGIQQDTAWRQSQADGAIAQLDQFVATNYSNPELVNAQKDIVKAQLAATFPGMDMTAQFAKLDQQTTGNRIGSYMAAGDLGKAKAILMQEGHLLGGKADEYAMRITNKEESNLRKALAYDALNERKSLAAAKVASNNAQKDVTDALLSGDYSSAQSLIAKNRHVLDANDYNRLVYAAHRPPAATSDSMLVMKDLMALKVSQDPAVREQAPAMANAAYLRGDITGSTRDSFTKSTYEAGDKQALETIKDFFSSMTFDKTAGISLARAQVDYFVWKENNPQASPSERLDKSLQFIKDYSIIQLDKDIVWAEMTPYVTKADILNNGLPAIVQGEAALNEAFNSNTITQQEFNRQALRLANLRKITESNMKATSAKQGKNK